ncbi:MAG: glycosyltransferase, partial [Chitinophagaceae bacterium]|nr:glycosyltransferase [Chitinophagaceae bacterium]
VILAGWHDDVEYFMAQSDLFIHPSYREGFPNVVLQAGAMECGVLVSRIPGNVDIVDDQENGFIFAVQDAEDLYQKLNQALREPQRMKELGQELRKKIEANFDRRYVQDQLRQKYEALLAASGKSNK